MVVYTAGFTFTRTHAEQLRDLLADFEDARDAVQKALNEWEAKSDVLYQEFTRLVIDAEITAYQGSTQSE